MIVLQPAAHHRLPVFTWQPPRSSQSSESRYNYMKHSLALKRNLCLQNLPSSHGKFLDNACWTHCCYLMSSAPATSRWPWPCRSGCCSESQQAVGLECSGRCSQSYQWKKQGLQMKWFHPPTLACCVFTAASSRKVGSGTHLELTCWKRVRPCWNMLKHLLRITESETCLYLYLLLRILSPFTRFCPPSQR